MYFLLYRDKKSISSAVITASSSSAVVVRKRRYGSADDAPTVSVSEPNLLTNNSHKPTKSSSKHKGTKQTNENNNNGNSLGHNLRRSMLSVSDTSLNKISHNKRSGVNRSPTLKSESKDVKETSPEQVVKTCCLLSSV